MRAFLVKLELFVAYLIQRATPLSGDKKSDQKMSPSLFPSSPSLFSFSFFFFL